MAGADGRWEASRDACRRFWQSHRERYHQEGLTAPIGAECPYPPRSFAALHWQRGHSQRDESA